MILRVQFSGKLDPLHIQNHDRWWVSLDQAVSQKFPPTWHVRSTSSMPSPSGNGLSITLKSADDAKDGNKRWEMNTIKHVFSFTCFKTRFNVELCRHKQFVCSIFCLESSGPSGFRNKWNFEGKATRSCMQEAVGGCAWQWIWHSEYRAEWTERRWNQPSCFGKAQQVPRLVEGLKKQQEEEEVVVNSSSSSSSSSR